MSSRPFRPLTERLEARDLPAAPFENLPVLPFTDPAVLDNARTIALTGQALGRRADAFMKVGDSNSALFFTPDASYLIPLGLPGYDPIGSGLAARPELLDTLRAFQSPVGGGGNSFTRASPTAFPGATVAALLPRLAEEVRATNAGVALVTIGTNDLALHGNPDLYRAELAQVVRTLTGAGVLPVLTTLPNHVDNPVLPARVRQFNQVVAEVGEEFRVPVWNLAVALAALPAEGLRSDGVHLNSAPGGSGNLTPAGLLFGQNVRNLGALQVLDWFRERVALGPPEFVPPLDWTPLPPGQPAYAVGRGEGQGPSVSVFSAAGRELNRFYAFDPGLAGGVRVAVADVNGDGIPDVVTGAGPGGGPVVRAFSGADGSVLASFFAYDPAFRNGIGSLDAADLDGDGKAEIVVGAGVGGGPVVAVFRGGDFAEAGRFFAYDPAFRGGVNVAVGTFLGTGPAIVTAAGPGGGPVVRLFAPGSPDPLLSFLAGNPSDMAGWVLAAGDFDGDGAAEVALGPGQGVPRVRIFDPLTGAGRADFLAGPDSSGSGVRLAALPGGEGIADTLIVGFGPGGPVAVKGFVRLSGTPVPLGPDDPTRAYGVYVG
jgi:hypothetical protein